MREEEKMNKKKIRWMREEERGCKYRGGKERGIQREGVKK
jgi:hypothetical protein